MSLTLAALVYRPDRVSDEALSRGFAVALAGWDVPAPALSIAELPAAPGWSVAFYESGAARAGATSDDELEHVWELFEDDDPPARCVLEAAGRPTGAGGEIYAIVYSDDLLLDDAWRFDARTHVRRFVREGEDGIEIGTEDGDEDSLRAIDFPDEDESLEVYVREHRGTTLLTEALRTASLPAIAGGFFAIDRRVPIRLADPGEPSVVAEVQKLNLALRRTDGRGAFEPPVVAGVSAPPVVCAFARTYDFQDPADPRDEYREIAIGEVEGTLSFLRADGLARLGEDARWAASARAGLYPVGRRTFGGRDETLALAADQERLVLVDGGGRQRTAGPTFVELLAYLALGYRRREPFEEMLIEALMLRARVRVEHDRAG